MPGRGSLRIVDEEARRLAILQASYAVISREGLQGVTIRAIAQEAGCSTGMVVHYFQTKRDILLKTQHFAESQVRSRMLGLESSMRGFNLLRSLVMEVLPVDERRRKNWAIWMSFWNPAENAEPDSLAEQNSRIVEWHSRLRNALNQALNDREVVQATDVDLEAEGLAAFVEGLAVQVVIYKRELGSQMMISLLDGYLNRLAARG